MSKREKGFALFLTLFLVVGISMVAAAQFIAVSRHQRSVQRHIDQVKTNWVTESVIDLGIREISDYITVYGKYPDCDGGACAADKAVLCKTSEGAALKCSDKAKSYYDDTVKRLSALLARIGIDDAVFSVKQIGEGNADSDASRDYRIEVKMTGPGEGISAHSSQKVRFSAGKLFDQYTFYNTDLEICPGPNFTLEGPIFSNGDVYLMTDINSTLNMLPPTGVVSTDKDYFALQSAGNIYFYFKRFVAKNYLFERNSIYAGSIPDNLKTAYHSDPQIREMLNVSGGTYPLFYFGDNGIYKETTLPAGKTPPKIQVNGQNLSYYNFGMRPYYHPKSLYTAYVNSSSYAGTIMSVSPAYAGTSFPNMKSGWKPADPVSDTAPVNPAWANHPYQPLIKDKTHGVEEKTVPVGSLSDNVHPLIDPPAAVIPTTEEGRTLERAKLAGQAHVRILCNANDNCETFIAKKFVGVGSAGADWAGYATFSLSPSVAGTEYFFDYRLGGKFKAVWLDINELRVFFRDDPTLFHKDVTGKGFSGYLVYVEVAEAGPGGYPIKADQSDKSNDDRITLVKLKNAATLPKYGLSIATNGRLWISGHYNLYDWVTCRECTMDEWEGKICTVPPAGIFSDSFGVVSADSIRYPGGPTVDYTNAADLSVRQPAGDVMVNAAIVTGFLPSQLEEIYPECTGTTAHPDKCLYRTDPADSQPLRDATKLWAYTKDSNSGLRPTNDSWIPGQTGGGCTDGLKADGQPVDPSDCDFYRDTQTGIFYYRTIRMPKAILAAMQDEDNYIKDAARQTRWTNWGVLNPARVPEPWKVTDTEPGIAPLFKIINNQVTGWSGLTRPEIEDLKRLPGKQYKIPVEKQHPDNSGDWFLVCCEKGTDDKCIPGGPSFRCRPGMSGFDRNKIKYREFDLHFEDVLPTDLPANGSGFITCPQGVPDTRPCGFDGVSDYGDCPASNPARCNINRMYDGGCLSFSYPGRVAVHGYRNVNPQCTIEAAPLMAGVQFLTITIGSTGGFMTYPAKTANCWYEDQGGGEGGAIISVLKCEPPAPGQPAETYGPVMRTTAPILGYYHGRYHPLYRTRYSGGLENLVNYQERWQKIENNVEAWQRTVRFSGILAAPWHSQHLRVKKDNKTKPAYWNNTNYYTPPKRIAQYNEDLKTQPPPGAPGTYSLKRKYFKTEG